MLGTKIAVPETVVAPCKRTADVNEGNLSSAGGKKKGECLLQMNRDSSMLFHPVACILLAPVAGALFGADNYPCPLAAPSGVW